MASGPLPVTLVTGYLGAGKTTLVNHLVAAGNGKRIAVVENEIASSGVDTGLLSSARSVTDGLRDGCVCRTLRGDLVRVLTELTHQRQDFDHVLIETTGLAAPGPVAAPLLTDPQLRRWLRLDSIVTVVDARHVWKELGDSRECVRQIELADILLVNKVDLVSLEEAHRLQSKLRSINARASVHRVRNSAVAVDAVLDMERFDLDRALALEPRLLEVSPPVAWAGAFRLEAGELALAAEPAEDTSIELMLRALGPGQPLDVLSESVREAVAAHGQSAAKRVLAAGDRLEPGDDFVRVELTSLGATRSVRIPRAGLYGLYTDVHPWDCPVTLLTSAGRIEPVAQRSLRSDRGHDASIVAVSLSLAGDLESPRLNEWICDLMADTSVELLRIKGVVALHAKDHRFLLQGVRNLFEGRPGRAWSPGEERRSVVVVIGRRLDPASLQRSFSRCLFSRPRA